MPINFPIKVMPLATTTKPKYHQASPQKSARNVVDTYRDTIKPRKKEIATFTENIPKSL